jgi:uncharacterized protein with PQ loop repeat
MVSDELSYSLSIISLLFYSIIYIPQFFVIYKAKSSSGISLLMILLWTQADILSLIGTIVLNMYINIIIIGWSHFIVGVFMIIFILYYRDKYDDNLNNPENSSFTKEYKIELLSSIIFLCVNTAICIILNVVITSSHDLIGEIIGWVTTVFYIVGRFPQIWLNYKSKSTEGLSVLMYVFAILGNATYIAVFTIDPQTIQTNMPWIVSSTGMIILDLYIIYQNYYYVGLESIIFSSI